MRILDKIVFEINGQMFFCIHWERRTNNVYGLLEAPLSHCSNMTILIRTKMHQPYHPVVTV